MLYPFATEIQQPAVVESCKQEVIKRLRAMRCHQLLSDLGFQHESVAKKQIHE